MADFGRYAQQISRYKFDDDVNDKRGAKIRARRLHQSLINEDYNNLEKINKTYAQMGLTPVFKEFLDMHYDLVGGGAGAGVSAKTEPGVDSDSVEEVEAPPKDEAEVVDISEDEAEVISPADYTTMHMKGGGLGCGKGNFTLAYWKRVKALEVELPEPCPVTVMKLRTMERADLHKKEWILITLPKNRLGPGCNEYDRYRKHFNALKVVGVDQDGNVYRARDKDIQATSPFPPGFTGAMYAEAVELFFNTTEKKKHEKQEAKRAEKKEKARKAQEEAEKKAVEEARRKLMEQEEERTRFAREKKAEWRKRQQRVERREKAAAEAAEAAEEQRKKQKVEAVKVGDGSQLAAVVSEAVSAVEALCNP